ncbi:ABC transporter transmembrane domain-containing protein [Rothia sp. CCM 9419]|uniref:ABC transporter transmembrane domain-containing protein n=1 Tax=Rothia sp. CCM 9419 TaxID=3402662 RepID=UPI003ADC5D2D
MASSEQQQNRPSTQVSFRLRPPGGRYNSFRWYLPFVSETLAGIATIFLPAFIGNIISAHAQGDSSWAWKLTTGLSILIVLLIANEYIGWGTAFRNIAALDRDWKRYACSYIPQLKNTSDPGNIITVVNKDTKTVAYLYQPLMTTMSGLSIIVLGAVQLWLINPLIAVVSCAGVLLTLVTITVISRFLEKRAAYAREKVGVNTSYASDISSALRTIVGLGVQQTMMSRYRQTAVEVRHSQLSYQRLQSWSAFSRVFLIGMTTMAAVALALRGEIIDAHWVTTIPAEQLVTVTGIISMMVSPVWSMEFFLYMWRQARVSLSRIEELKERTQKTFHHNGDKPATQNYESNLSSGRVHYLNPKKYQLSAEHLADVLTQELQQRYGAHNVLLSRSQPMIFAGTLEEHLQLGQTEEMTQERMSQLLELSDAQEIVHRLDPQRTGDYAQCLINSEGTNLSGGQRQRLGLARALAQNKTHLVLCEPINSVDEPSQRFILDRLEEECCEDGLLEHLHGVYIVSTTVETEKRRILQESMIDG